MKRLLLITLGMIFFAGAAFGQAGYIGLFSDPGYTDCALLDDVSGVKTIYAVHKAASGVTASQFMVTIEAGMTCVDAGVIHSFPTTIGSPTGGISIAYGACRVSDILLFSWNWICSGTTTPCTRLEVVPDDAALSGMIEVVDCDAYKLFGNGSTMYVNQDSGCDCGEVVPNQESSWGRIKALYR